jgi:hypothetical protein
MEVRFNVTDDEFMENLQKTLQVKTAPEVVKQALTLLNWAVGEISSNRIVLSSDLKGQNVHRLVMPALDRVKKLEPMAAVAAVANA